MNLDVTVVFERNWDAIHAVDENGERLYKYIINSGSSRSSKTYSLIDCYDLYARGNANKRMTAWRITKKDTKDTIMADFLKRLKETNRFKPRLFNITESIYKYPNGSTIEFRGADEESVFGLTQDCAWLNEPYSISRDVFDQIDQRTSDFIFIDLNPKENHWSDDLIKHPRALVLHSTFEDNPFCPPEQRLKILSYDPSNPENVINKTANQFKWSVYGLGLKAEVEGKVFTNYEEIETIPANAKFYGYGFDYGYSKDPTAIVALYTNGNNIYLEELIYSTDLQPEMLHKEMLRVGMLQRELIIGDRTAELMIQELFDRGWGDIHRAEGTNSILFGIAKMRECNIFLKGKNLVYEFDNYKNKKDRTGKWIDKPEENQTDHCFVGETLITTIEGEKRIDKIKVGDLVLTSQGYKKVLKVWDNGIKSVNNYSIHCDIFKVNLCSTSEHLIKINNNQWKQISKLKKGMTINYVNSSMVNLLSCNQEKNTSITETLECTSTFGSSTMAKYLKGITYTIKTKILTTIGLRTLKLSKLKSIYQNMANNVIKIIPNGQKNFIEKELKKPLNGIGHQRESNGINNTHLTATLGIKHMDKEIANVVDRNLLQRQTTKDFVQMSARQGKEGQTDLTTNQDNAQLVESSLSQANIVSQSIVQHTQEGKRSTRQVYDLEIEDCHEYFANGILVHNCIDSARYITTDYVTRNKFFVM